MNDSPNAGVPAARVSRRQVLGGIGALAVGVMSAPLLAACSSDDSSSSSSGGLGGTLNFIGYDGEDGGDLAQPFLNKNDITIKVSYVTAASDPLTKFLSGGKGQMDVMAVNKDFQRSVLESDVDLFQPLDMSRLPNAAGLFKGLATPSWLVKDDKVYGIPLIWGDEPCIYNPKNWDGVPAKYTDFADPTYHGELVLLDDPIANTWLFAKSLGFPEPNRLTQDQLNQAIAALGTIKPNVVTISASLGDMADIMVRGDASMGLGGWAYQTIIAKDKGVTLVTASPADDGTFYWSDAYTIAVDSPNEDNAYAYIDYMMSAQVNAKLATNLGSGATIEAAYDLLSPSQQNLYDYDLVRTDAAKLEASDTTPPNEDEGDIVGVAKWMDAWQQFKAS